MPTTDKSLLERLQEEPDSDAWNTFQRLYRPFIESQIRKYRSSLRNYTDDITQDVVLVLIKEIRNFEWQQQGDFRSWLKVVTINRIRSLARKVGSKEVPGDFGEWLIKLEDPNSEASAKWDREHDQIILSKILDLVRSRVEEQSWNIFNDVFVHGVPAEKVARDHAVSSVQVYNIKSRLLKFAREEAEGLVD